MRLAAQGWTITSLTTGAIALVTLLLAFSTRHWLFMKEQCKKAVPVKYQNQSEIIMLLNMTMETDFGLLMFCTSTTIYQAGKVMPLDPVCMESGISKGLEKNKEREDTQWRTGTVIEATRIQFPLTCLACILTLAGFVCSIVGNFRRDRRTIIAAAMYISSGLCLSVSIILFISRINDELSLDHSPDCSFFSYVYDWSFYLVSVSFVMEETSAVISIKLYLTRKSKNLTGIVQIIPGLEDKVHTFEIEPDNHTLIW